MARKSKKTYRSYHPVRTILVAMTATIFALILLAVAIFFGFQKYEVFTPDGVRLVIPWLSDVTPVVSVSPS